MKTLPSLTIFFPAFNDEHSLASLINTAYIVGKKVSYSLEVMVIDDGSTDGTATALTNLQKTHKTLRVISHKKNEGYGVTVSDGIGQATKEFIFYTDGDGQYDVGELRKLIDGLDDEVDIVNGWKVERSDPWYRRLVGMSYQTAMRWAFQLPIRDVDCDFRLMRAALVKELPLQSASGGICVELIKKAQMAGARFAEVPVRHYPRKYGTSQFFQLGRIGQTFLELVHTWFDMAICNTRSHL